MTISQRFVSTPFAAGVVGSLPRPLMVREMLPEAPGPASGEAAHSLRMDASVNYAIAIQEQAVWIWLVMESGGVMLTLTSSQILLPGLRWT